MKCTLLNEHSNYYFFNSPADESERGENKTGANISLFTVDGDQNLQIGTCKKEKKSSQINVVL